MQTVGICMRVALHMGKDMCQWPVLLCRSSAHPCRALRRRGSGPLHAQWVHITLHKTQSRKP